MITGCNYAEWERRKIAQRFLQQIEDIDYQIKSMIEEIEALQDKAYSITSIQTDKPRVMTSQQTEARFAGYIVRKSDIEYNIDQELVRLVDMKIQIREIIDQVPDVKCQLILRYRYIHLFPWPETRQRLNLGEKAAYNLHKKALSFVADILDAQNSAKRLA